MPPILNAQTITKQFGAKPLFKDISFTVEDGSRIGLIGPNGAGKSTLLAILAGAVEPDAGELAVRKRARAAYVPQDSRFAAGLTVRQVLTTVGVLVLPTQFALAHAASAFHDDGTLKEDGHRAAVAAVVAEVVAVTARLNVGVA